MKFFFVLVGTLLLSCIMGKVSSSSKNRMDSGRSMMKKQMGMSKNDMGSDSSRTKKRMRMRMGGKTNDSKKSDDLLSPSLAPKLTMQPTSADPNTSEPTAIGTLSPTTLILSTPQPTENPSAVQTTHPTTIIPVTVDPTSEPTATETLPPTALISSTAEPTENTPVVQTTHPTTTPPGTAEPTGKPSSESCSNVPQPSIPISCEPTVGPCIATGDALQTLSLATGDVVSLCSGSTLTTTDTVKVAVSDVTLCCESIESSLCTIEAAPDQEHQLLHVTGESFTMAGVALRGGVAGEGGNLALEAAGQHLVQGCLLENGVASGPGFGGNLFLSGGGSLTLVQSQIKSGQATQWGGGLAFFDAPKVLIDECEIIANTAPYAGGIVSFWSSGSDGFPVLEQDVTISRSVISDNNSQGYVASNLGSMPRLRILETAFDNNTNGGVSVCCADLDDFDLVLCDLSGTVGVPSSCDQILIYGETASDQCLSFEEGFP